MSPRKTNIIDQLIAESKQVTCDLMALRHEIDRLGLKRRNFYGGGGPADRARLICDNAQALADGIHKIWEAAIDRGRDEDESPVVIEKPRRALGNGQLRLTSGGR